MSEDLNLGSLTLDNTSAVSALDEVQSKMGELKSATTEGSESTSGLLENFAHFSQAAEFVGEVVNKVVELGHAMLEAAVDSERHERALRSLGEAADMVSRSTNDVVEAEDAWRAQQRLTQAGIQVTSAQLAAITQRAREYAIATGTETPAALDQLTSALVSGAERGLRPFGLNVGDATDRSHAFAAAMGQIEARASSTSPSARTLGEDVHRVSNNLHDAVSAAAGWIAEMTGFQSVIAAIGDALGTLSGQADSATTALDNVAAHARQATAAARGSVRQQQVGYVNTALQRAGAGNLSDLLTPAQQAEIASLSERLGHGSNVNASQLGDDSMQRVVEILASRTGDTVGGARPRAEGNNELFDLLRGSLDDTATQQANASVAARESGIQQRVDRLRQGQQDAALQSEAERRAGIHRHGAGGGRATNNTASRMARDEMADAENAKRQQYEVTQAQIHAAEEAAQAEMEAAGRVKAAQNEVLQQQIHHNEELERIHDRTMERAREEAEQQRENHDLSVQMRNTSIQMFHTEQTAAQSSAQTIGNIWGSIGSAFEKHVLAVTKGQESIGQALEAMGKEIMEAVFRESIVQALMEGAKAIASAAGGDYVDAAEHGAAAAAFGAVAIATGIGVAATASAPAQGGQAAAPPPNSSMNAGAGGGSSPGSYGGGSGGGGKIEINLTVGGNIYSREHAEDEIHAMAVSAARRGADMAYFQGRWHG